ncbi:unnamed protein product [Fusarium graminearum]|uniref:Chromosome 1, complete genome n=1 Tax=Gibberella zeae (strain ATCC MYA-4620 / CBS 123657 / FGSC 9075 / NRRL 31084 / PH-1) TaxID=229533 RepID=A0A098D259_GIBZE|nr:unnamed protein product [Fusarium graminearum]CZS75811.1 unnamed protein product [Fusarium graminearum]
MAELSGVFTKGFKAGGLVSQDLKNFLGSGSGFNVMIEDHAVKDANHLCFSCMVFPESWHA